MNDIKRSIDHNLREFVVTDELRQKTIQQLQLEKKVRFIPRFYLRSLRLVSTFVLMIVIVLGMTSMNQFNKSETPNTLSKSSNNPPIENSFEGVPSYEKPRFKVFEKQLDPQEDDEAEEEQDDEQGEPGEGN